MDKLQGKWFMADLCSLTLPQNTPGNEGTRSAKGVLTAYSFVSRTSLASFMSSVDGSSSWCYAGIPKPRAFAG
jgi:hypothetical protein